jgi:exosortase/archaeosortase family protein
MFDKIRLIFSDKVYRFLAGIVIIFLIFIVFYYILRKINFINTWYINQLNQFTIFLLYSSKLVVQQFGYEVVTYGKTIQIIDHFRASGVYLDRGCMGRNVMISFLGLILVYPGKFIHKLWYIPMGLIILISVNISRISALTIIAYCCPKYSDINHHVIFRIVAWAVIFLLWAVWINKFGTIKFKKKQNP